MKAAVISDIHGNMEALKAVLDDIQEQGIEKIFCLGDLAFCGPEPEETINFIRNNLADATIIQGNTDEMIVKATDAEDDPYMPKKDVMANALKYSQKVVSQENKAFLASLPADHIEEYEGLKLLFVHGSPRKNDEGMFPKTKYSKLQEMVEGTTANIIFCGHTHYPVIHRVDDKSIVNVGSVGRPFEENPRAVYVMLDLSNVKDRKFTLEHRYVKYDHEKAAEKLEKCDFDGADVLAWMLRRATDQFPQPSELKA